MSKIAIIRCDSYDYPLVKNSVQKGIDLLGGIGRFASRGEKILLKPNLLMASAPGKCVTTHPSVFRAVAEIFLSEGARVSYGDSPAVQGPLHVAKKAGIASVAGDLKIDLADFKTGVEVVYEKGVQNKKFIIAKGVVESDAVISLPKMKAHAFQRYTGAIKNQFGCIPGLLKGEFHVKMPDPYLFAQMLVDLTGFVRPRLYIMDGIYSMEGNGPSGGTPRKSNMIIMSRDPVALDATVCRLIGMDPEFVPVLRLAMEAGLGTSIESEIELAGDDPLGLRDGGFDIKRSPFRHYNFKRKRAYKILNDLYVSKPVIAGEKCVQCGACIDVCPVVPKALGWKDGDKKIPPVYDYDKCIRCYCCQEICPESAISLKAPLLRRIFRRDKRV